MAEAQDNGEAGRRAEADRACGVGAGMLTIVGSRKEAIAAYERAVAIVPEHSHAWDMLGRIHGEDGRHDAAEYSFGRALKAATTPREEGVALEGLGTIAMDKKDLSSALDFYQRALSLLEQIDGEAKTVTRCARRVGSIKRHRRDADAEKSLQHALSLSRSNQMPEEELACLHELVELATIRRRSNDLEQLLNSALVLEIRLDRKKDQARSLRVLGAMARQRGDLARAQNHLQQALKISQQLDDQQGVALVFHELGLIVRDQGDADGAYKLFKQSLTIAEQQGLEHLRAEMLNLLGDIEYRCDRLDEAERWLNQALTVSTQCRDLGQQAGALYTLGCVAEDRRDHREKMRCWTAARERAVAAGDATMAENIAQLLREAGR